jgi:endonuclease/exonuclease/phosphatase (EEP) superfamily protein YafD
MKSTSRRGSEMGETTPVKGTSSLRQLLTWCLRAGVGLGIATTFVLASTRYMGADGFVSCIPTNFQWHYLIVALLLLGIASLLRFRTAAVGAALLTTYQCVAMAPYYLPRERVDGPAQFRVAVANINGANQETARFHQWVNEVDADIILLQETDDHWPAFIARTLSDYPYKVSVTSTQWGFGATILSRLPIVEHADVRPSGEYPVQRAVVQTGGQLVALYNLHLLQGGDSRRMLNEYLLNRVKGEKIPCIVAGDFNSTIWSGSHQRFPSDAELENAAFGSGYLTTWPARLGTVYGFLTLVITGQWPVLPSEPLALGSTFAKILGIPLDHIYVSREIGIVQIERCRAINSDHLPQWVDLCISANSKRGSS